MKTMTGSQVRELRKEMKLTQAELARSIKASNQTICLIENGKYTISGKMQKRLNTFFAVTEVKETPRFPTLDVSKQYLITIGQLKMANYHLRADQIRAKLLTGDLTGIEQL